MYKNKTRNDVNPLHSAVYRNRFDHPYNYIPSTFPSRRRVGGRHVWKNDDNVSIFLHKQERASWLDFLGYSLLFIDIEITLIWVTFGFRLLLFFTLLEISNKSSEKVYVTEIKSPHFLSYYSENRAVFLLRSPFFISRVHLHYYRTS